MDIIRRYPFGCTMLALLVAALALLVAACGFVVWDAAMLLIEWVS
jgi:hypothetical protein